MSKGLKSYNVHVTGEAEADIFKALGSETRLKILALLAVGDRNINELGLELGLSQPTVSMHVQTLEQAGLILSEYMPGIQGMQKRCRLRFDKIIVSFEANEASEERIEEISMPVGLYSYASPVPQCGLANRDKIIGFLDIPQSFFDPDRATAEILWMAAGYVEYVFPNTLPSTAEILKLELIMEACSEAPNYNQDWPSDISVWINDVELGAWTSPGDFGAKRGLLNPKWWIDHMTQHGALKIWSVDQEGVSLDGAPLSDVTLAKANVVPNRPINLRIGVKPDAIHQGGFNLFGKGFGNYAQDIVLRLHYVMSPSVAVTGDAKSLNLPEEHHL